MIVEKQLNELSVGHFVTEIAKQNGTFSLKAPGHIKSINVINHLKSKSVISVFIDDEKHCLSQVKVKLKFLQK